MPSSVNLGPALEDIVERLVANGRFNSRSEVLREGVRRLHEREVYLLELETALARGISDAKAGRVVELGDGFDSIREEAGINEKAA